MGLSQLGYPKQSPQEMRKGILAYRKGVHGCQLP